MPSSAPRSIAPAPAARLPHVLQFMQVLWAVVHGLDRTSKRMAREIGVTGPQRLVLRVVGLSPGLSAGDLAVILHVHPSTLSGVLQRLVTQRLLVRAVDPGDRRRVRLRLTAHGARVNAVRHGTVESAVAEALTRVTPRDRAATARVLAELALRVEPPPRRRQSRSRRMAAPSKGARRG
ncbi:MAG TPA: MarR family transcriptional regulator [Gemmatimonadales bacterium]|nr:MarR family transcriptional regulator [Gemmatimonadales bacterium]